MFCPSKEKGNNILKVKKCGFKTSPNAEGEWFCFLEEAMYLYNLGVAVIFVPKIGVTIDCYAFQNIEKPVTELFD